MSNNKPEQYGRVRIYPDSWIAGLCALIILLLAIVFIHRPPKVGEDDIGEDVFTTSTSIVTTIETTTNITTSGTAAETSASITTSADTSCITSSETVVTEVVQGEQNPETNAPETEVQKEEDPQPEPEPEPIKEPERVEPAEEFLVYKPSTYYIHRNTCRWNKGDAYRVDSVEGLEARLCTECNPECEGFTEYIPPVEETPSPDGMTYVGYFGRVTYYPATAYYDGVRGGSDRTLLGYGDYGNGIRGSIASRSLWSTYGYNYNGRTTVYLEFPGYESMNGFYYLDDCCRDYGVIDVFVWSDYACPFYNAGVITANCYI